MSENDNEKGAWRTVSGRHIFIKDGQSKSEAMKESGKFRKEVDEDTKKKTAPQKPLNTVNNIEESNAESRANAMAKIKERIEKKNNEKEFREQLIKVQDGTFDKKSYLQLGRTPQILIDKAGIPKLPLMMPYSKAYLSINKSGVIEGNYHDLGVGTLSQLPTALHSPKYIFRHDNPKRIEVVVELKDKKDKNILASVEFDTYGLVNEKRIPANMVVTAFAPRNVNYIDTRKGSGKLLYEKKS